MESSQCVRWGIVGTGQAAVDFAHDLKLLPDARLAAVCSRSAAKAAEFAQQFDAESGYHDIQQFVADDDIDVVYVATPNHQHKSVCITCLQADKAVLCEKPFALDSLEARQIVDVAQARGVFCMEGMWMRFIPATLRVKQLIESGVIGDVQMINIDFGVATHYDPDSRHFDLGQGGGALLDRAVYGLSLISFLMGSPDDVVALSNIGETGVDEQSALVCRYNRGCLATVSASLTTNTPNEAVILGSKGHLKLHNPFFRSHRISQASSHEPAESPDAGGFVTNIKKRLRSNHVAQILHAKLGSFDVNSKVLAEPFRGNGLNYEAAEVMRCIRAGETESGLMPLAESIEILQTLDNVRDTIGLEFPGAS